MLGATWLMANLAGSTARPSLWEQPFAPSSIWNLPIGSGAKYVPAALSRATDVSGLMPDADVIVFTPHEKPVDFYLCTDDWNRNKSRCMPTDPNTVVLSGPMPAEFVIPGNNDMLGGLPNTAIAILMADNRTIAQAQPAARCSPKQPATNHHRVADEDIRGAGIAGAHGGSGLSAIGGTLRLGELLPGAPPIRHALKIELFAHLDYWSQSPYFRWPATNADGYAPQQYGGKNPSMRPGSLLALDTAIDIDTMGLETTPAKALAWTLQNYGGYVVDDTMWSVYQLCVEYSPLGYVPDEFEQAYGYPMHFGGSGPGLPWARDMDRIFLNLSVVDNWDAATYARVAQSKGAEGAGGGKPLQPWIEPAP